MSGVPDEPWLVLAMVALPLVLITTAATIVAMLSLTARRPGTRRHVLAVLSALTGLAQVLRGRR